MGLKLQSFPGVTLLTPLEFIRSSFDRISYTHSSYDINLLTKLRIGLNDLNEPKFKHVFNDAK